MTEQEIIKEGNELIARFMGGVKQIIPKGGLNGYKEGTELWMSIFSDNPDPTTYLDFNESWDWLMPVVEKIEPLVDRFEISKYGASAMKGDIRTDNFFWKHGQNDGNKIGLVWTLCVEFIKWHNTNK